MGEVKDEDINLKNQSAIDNFDDESPMKVQKDQMLNKKSKAQK